MSRRNPRPKRSSARLSQEPRPLGDVFGRTEEGPGGETYIVRTVPGARAVKTYRCPGCDHEIPPGVAHIVAWAAEGGEDDRRHWHTGCWKGRHTRTITRRWS
ncbi:ATP/GTP-binding protein [Nocardia terpenica]|uniref:ATP/GTP-binding protein n=1 Tax=Nocardia terpenica TaxID=455432 RepID=A0A161ZA96_9NOCA|nr:ATP/GTP-binding protein [Nocardia terpenica]KZM76082.1 ATP/GTP-binding protein [Nocardia terpenica]MBF6063557.1 ATP/GTP-binding protein [Nocardia terpenica]MBF6109465.1 ATP/GTP-binding protein [Nocardia terpenica]MBF6114106.1 ATP/GTP-binding protein [Nocardia terpenica]MBF6123877.1 ATP/GTP-binding protein [Nocardia terpenica]